MPIPKLPPILPPGLKPEVVEWAGRELQDKGLAALLVTRDVPCGSCTECCRNECVRLYPQWGDDVKRYRTRRVDGQLALQQRPNGACVYLDEMAGEARCTIWQDRPLTCRIFDCRWWLDAVREMNGGASDLWLTFNGKIRPAIMQAAKRLRKQEADDADG
jgi:hypothetical protein